MQTVTSNIMLIVKLIL